MAAASVLIPLSVINQNGGVLPPSALSQQTPRHGRSRGMSLNGKNTGGRYRVVEDSDATVAKAVTFVLKRTVSESELESDMEEGEYLIADADGWVSVAHLLEQPRMQDLRIQLADIRHASTSPKARFTLRQHPGGCDPAKPESYQVRREGKRDSTPQQDPLIPAGEPLTADSPEDLPEYVVYETSYQHYPRVLGSGGIKRADGAAHIAFAPASSSASSKEADVRIWVHLRTALAAAAPDRVWQHTTSGRVVTSAESVPVDLWKRAVARRPDIGLLFEDGVVHKEIPAGLRGRGAKGKAKRGKGGWRQDGRGGSESDSVEDDV
ncbi:putative tRNA 2'-phosphotransferase 1 [Xylariomycetidae sp. FL0641]|nr:putative tRNA 2'-phosphotransferase 1 [Xylariomycetidae sp. FL0641]